MENINDYAKKQSDMCVENDSIPKALYADYGVKKGRLFERSEFLPFRREWPGGSYRTY